MKKGLTIAFFIALALIGIIYLIGLFLPSKKTFVKTATFKSEPETIFQVVTNVEEQASWRSDVREIIVIDQKTWTEVPKKGSPITFRIKQKVPNSLFEIEIIEPKNFNGSWIGTFEQTPTGTKVVFKEEITIDNPFFRVFSLIFVDLNASMDLYLENLKNKLEV